MPPFDLATLINWIASEFVTACFATLVAWVTYRYQRKRDDIKWERRITELERQAAEKKSARTREEIVRNSDDPAEAIHKQEQARNLILASRLSGPAVGVLRGRRAAKKKAHIHIVAKRKHIRKKRVVKK